MTHGSVPQFPGLMCPHSLSYVCIILHSVGLIYKKLKTLQQPDDVPFIFSPSVDFFLCFQHPLNGSLGKGKEGNWWTFDAESTYVSIAVLMIREFSTYTIFWGGNFVHSLFIFILWRFSFLLFWRGLGKLNMDVILCLHSILNISNTLYLILSQLFQRKW